MNAQTQPQSVLWYAAGGLVVYSLVLTYLTGDIGFEGDDWWVFSWAYWSRFPESILIYAKESLRPVEGIYWITLFELFGFNKIAFHLFSMLLLASASVVMGLCVLTAFPTRPVVAITSTLVAFFLPVTCCLTYVLATDNSRLSMLLFWVCTFAFQKWRIKGGSWRALATPGMLYLCAFLTYETSSMLIFTVPFFVWPVHKSADDGMDDRTFIVRLITGVLGTFACALSLRFLLLRGGAVGHSHFFPPFELVWAYLALLPHYLIEPFKTRPVLVSAFVVGIAAAVVAFVLLRRLTPQNAPTPAQEIVPVERFDQSLLYIAALGAMITMLGMLPYQLAGYGSVVPMISETAMVKWGLAEHGHTAWFNFNWSSRIYSSAGFGVSLLLAAAVAAAMGACRVRIVHAGLAVVIGVFAAFHTGLHKDWQEAAAIRNDLVNSLVSNVPDVKSGTNFVFLNLESYHGRAAVFRGWGGLKELVRMLYDDRRLGAWYLYPYSWKWPNHYFQTAVVSPKGFASRGVDASAPLPHSSLVLLSRQGNSLMLLDRINSHDGTAPTGINWKGASSIQTNLSLVTGWSDTVGARKLVRDAWSTGLIASLRLSQVRLSARAFNKWSIALRTPGLKRAVIKR